MSTGFNNTYPSGTAGAYGNPGNDECPQEFHRKWTQGQPQDVDMGKLPGRQGFTTSVSTVLPTLLAAQAAEAGPQPIQTPEWRRNRMISNQFIPANFNPERETFMEARILANSGGFVAHDIFVSPEYPASYIFEETLKSLDIEPTLANIKRSRNPRSGRLQPIGVTALFIKLPHHDVTNAFFVK